jgi:hypothetical protein
MRFIKVIWFTLFAVICIPQIIWAQSFLEEGNVWFYEYNQYNPNIQTIDSIIISGDTLINEKLYKVLKSTTKAPCGTFGLFEFLREAEGKVFKFDQKLDKETLLIDFAETLTYKINYFSQASGKDEFGVAHVQGFDELRLADDSLVNVQYLHIENNQSYDDTTRYSVVENVGFFGQSGVLFPYLGEGLCDVSQGIKLRCHVRGQDTLKFETNDCFKNDFISHTNDSTLPAVSLYPNPATNHVSIPEGYQVLNLISIEGLSVPFTFTSSGLQILKPSIGLHVVLLEHKKTGRHLSAKLVLF